MFRQVTGMGRYKRIIFVCTDNTARSVMAEAVMKSILGKRPVEVLSRGLVVLFPEPVNSKVVAILKAHGLSPESDAARELLRSDVTPGTLILTMTAKEASLTAEKFMNEDSAEGSEPMPELQIMDIATFIGSRGGIEDVCGGSLADYGRCYEYIDMAVKMAAEIIFKEIEV